MLRLVEDARAFFHAAVRRVQADRLLRGLDLRMLTDRPPEGYRHVRVVGAGKAAMAMAGAVEGMLGDRLTEGHVVVPDGYRSTLPETQRAPRRIAVVEAGHPVPDARSERAAARALALASSCGEGDLLLVLLSGGGSALWAAPVRGVLLGDLQTAGRVLLASGADIHQMNTVRKHLSKIKGGGLARAAHPADVAAIIVSDVPGDVVSVIASGPTAPDPSTFVEASSVAREFGVWDRMPEPVQRILAGAVTAETPGEGDPCFERSRSVVVGTVRDALRAAGQAACDRGYVTRIRSSAVRGDARRVGRAVAREAMAMTHPTCLLWGGETTVAVTGDGRGGRNQEVAAAAALALDGCGRRIVVLSGGTDGIDGPTDAAGAWVTPVTARTARERGVDLEKHLDRNDTYEAFRTLGVHLRTGPTHTNVMDVIIALVDVGEPVE